MPEEVITAKAILEELKPYNIDNSWLISLGCFSECWSKRTKRETLKIIEHFLKKGNQIQLSTKKQIKALEIKKIFKYIKYRGQLVIFVSSATISKCNELEKKTDSISKRFKTFELSAKYPIITVLYIKPVLENITINDINLYRENIEKYGITDVVVGSLFTANKNSKPSPFRNKKLYYTPNNDEIVILESLKEISNIFTRSTEVVKKYSHIKKMENTL